MYIRKTPISNPDLSSILRLHTIDPTQVTADLQLYIGETLSKASRSTKWYTKFDVDVLVQRSCGLFIFASTVLTYIIDRSNDEGRRERLSKVTETVSRGAASTAPLDQIYELVLTEASRPDRVDPEELHDTRRVLACILTARASLSIQALADLIRVSIASLRGALERLPSLVHIPDDDTDPGIRTLHASFGDYMFGRAVTGIRITSAFGHDIFVRGCLRRLGRDDLCFNISRSRSSFEPNPDTLPDWIPLSLLYACIHWAHHLDGASDSSVLDESIAQVFTQKLLFWLEVLSSMKKLNVASGLLRIAGSAVKQQVVARFLREANFFVTSSYDPISRSAPHIYLSALPFAAKDSLIRQYFLPHCTGVASVKPFGIDRQGGSLVMILTGHEDFVTVVVYSNDGLHMASGSEDRTVRVWNSWTGEETMAPMRIDLGYIIAIAFVLSDKGVAVCTSDGLVRVRNITTGQDLQYWQYDGNHGIGRVVFSPDGTLFASGSQTGLVRIWNTDNGEQTVVIQGPASTVAEIVFSSNGQVVVAFSYPPSIHIWSSYSGLAIGDPLVITRVGPLAISSDGKVLAVAKYLDTRIEVWDLDSTVRVPVVLENVEIACRILFAPDGFHLAVVSTSGHIRFWDHRTMQETATPLDGYLGVVNSVSYSPDGLYIASASNDRTVRIWDAGTSGAALQPLSGRSKITSTAISSDNTFIVSGYSDGSVRVWNTQNGELKLEILLDHKTNVVSVAISMDGHLIASGQDHSRSDYQLRRTSPTAYAERWWEFHVVRLWDAQTGMEASKPFDHTYDRISQLAFSPDSASHLACISVSTFRDWSTSTSDARVCISSITSATARTFSTLSTFQCEPSELSIAFSPDGRLLAATDGFGNVHIWRTSKPHGLHAKLFEIGQHSIRSLTFSRDGMRIIVGTGGGTVSVWASTAGPLFSNRTDDSYAFNSYPWVACSPDERFIVRIKEEGRTGISHMMQFWEAPAHGVATTVRLYSQSISRRKAAFASDSQTIIIGGDDKIMIWQVEALRALSGASRCDPMAQLLSEGLEADGWAKGSSGELLLWVPQEYRDCMQLPPCTTMISNHRVVITADTVGLYHGDNWAMCWR